MEKQVEYLLENGRRYTRGTGTQISTRFKRKRPHGRLTSSWTPSSDLSINFAFLGRYVIKYACPAAGMRTRVWPETLLTHSTTDVHRCSLIKFQISSTWHPPTQVTVARELIKRSPSINNYRNGPNEKKTGNQFARSRSESQRMTF